MQTKEQQSYKQAAAEAALEYLKEAEVIGVGSGSTVNCFIDRLPRIDGAVAASAASEQRLRERGIRVLQLNDTGPLPVYIDGADEADAHRRLIKGGGGAMTREKVLACAARQFICILDVTKRVERLGRFPVAVETLLMARSHVARELVRLGGRPEWREGGLTDNGNPILDVHNLPLIDALAMEQQLDAIAGIVGHGLFIRRAADKLLIAGPQGVETL